MSHNRRALVVFLVAVAGFAAILLLAINSSSDGGDLEGDWTFELVVIDGEEISPLDGSTVTATFAGGELNGSAGCNSYFGSYTTDGDSITIGALGSTQRFCEDPLGVMDQEFAYLTLLGAAESFSVSDDILAIRVGDGRRIVYGRG